MGNFDELRVHPLLVTDTTWVIVPGTSPWEIAHGERRQQDKDDGVQDQATEARGALTGCDPRTKNATGRAVRGWAGDKGIQKGRDDIKFDCGHF